MSRGRNQDLADRFFGKTDTESVVGFEIAFAAFLATAVLAYPTFHAQWIGEVAAFAVLLITLIRRIAVASPFAPENKIMKRTVRLIEFSTAICAIVLFVSLSEKLGRVFGGKVIIWFSAFSTIILFALVIVQEFLFRDYLVWWYAKFDEKERRGDRYAPIWQDLKYICYWGSRARKNRSSWKELGKRVDVSRPDISDLFDGFDLSNLIKNITLLILFFSLINLPAILVGASSGDLLISLALPTIIFSHDHACYLYVAYGNTSYEEFRKPTWEIALWAVVYVIIVLLLLGQIPFAVVL